ncbi:MAG: Crp/Fnr family transcriptional regulator [Christensenellales bacterium]
MSDISHLQRYWDAIKSVKLFEDLSDEGIKGLLSCLRPAVKSLGDGEIVLSSGEVTSSIGVVLSGCMHGVSIKSDGSQTLIAVKTAGEIYGEILACTDGTPSPVSIYSVGKSVVMLIDYERLLTLCPDTCGHHSLLIRNMLRVISRQYFALHENIGYLTKKSVRAKLSAYLCAKSGPDKKSQFILPLRRSEMAEYLGIDRSAMSRELGRMKSEGIIDFYKNSFKILDFSRLEE